MKNVLFFIVNICFVFFAYSEEVYQFPDESKGFHWYNDPLEIDKKNELSHEKKEPVKPVITKENAEKLILALQKDLDSSKALAILQPTTANIAQYKRIQDAFTEMSSNFASQWKRTLLEYPELDYNLRYSHYNGVAGKTLEQDKQNRFKAILDLTNTYGLFFFYRGQDEIDKQFAGVVKQFSTTYSIPIVAVSVDNEISPYFPLTKKDKGIVDKLNIKYFPTIMLVNPKGEDIKPLSYGFMSLTDLENRFLEVSTDFKPNF